MIGIFDSGVGGLTVMRAICDELPSADIVYFGDTKHAPYGERSREELSRLTVDAIRRLTDAGATRIVSACNSVSASLAISLFDAFNVSQGDLIEMVGPTVAYFRDFEGRIALCATNATIQSGMYQNAFRMIGKDIQAVPIPQLAGLIESGASPEVIEACIRDAFADTDMSGCDVLILACTHYPLVTDAFLRVLGDVPVFNPAVAVAERAYKLFWPREVKSGATRFLVSQDSAEFWRLAAALFPERAYTIEVVE